MSQPGGWGAAAPLPSSPPPTTAGAGTGAPSRTTTAVASATGVVGPRGAPGAPATGGQLAGGHGTTADRTRGPSTPTLLARWRMAVTVACLLVMALTTASLLLSWEATRSAAGNTEQLVRVQGIKVNLLRADALATNAFLVGGLEPESQHAAYQQALVDTQHAIADAAQAQPADRAALAALNAAVLEYAQNMELARANNRQGFPVGQAYLTVAGNGLRSTALPIVDNLVTASQHRSTDDMSVPKAWLVAIPGVLGLVVLILANRWLARRFRRRINVGIALAAIAVLVGSVAAVVVTQSQATTNGRLADGDYATVVSGSTARSAGNDAKAQESLRLINRGSGSANEAAFAANARTITSGTYHAPIADTKSLWGAYATGHARIVALDNDGNWDDAVALATSTAKDAPGAAFTAFDDYLAKGVDTAARSTVDALHQRLALFLVVAALTALLGLVAAGATWRGVSARLEEYA